MLKRLFWLILGFLFGSSIILFIYGDFNKEGIFSLKKTYHEVREEEKEEDLKIIKEYMENVDSSNYVKEDKKSKIQLEEKNIFKKINKNVMKETIKPNQNKWNKYFKNLDFEESMNTDLKKTFKNLDESELILDKKITIIAQLPYYNDNEVFVDGRTGLQYRMQLKNNLENIIKLKKEIGDKFNFAVGIPLYEYESFFDSNPVKLIERVKKDYPKINMPIYIVKERGMGVGNEGLYFSNWAISLSDYLAKQKFSNKYVKTFSYVYNGEARLTNFRLKNIK